MKKHTPPTKTLLAITAVAALSFFATPATAEDVGTIEELVNVGYGTPPSATRVRVEHKDGVVMDELLETDAQSALKVVFADGSELTMGESSSAVIDEFVYSGSQNKSSLNLVKGAFRFISGEMPKDAVEIKPPAVTMGIRGTDLRIRIGDDGTTRLVVESGLAFMTGIGTTFTITIPAGFEIMANKFGQLTNVTPAGEGNAPKTLGSKIGDVAIDENLQNAKDQYEYAELTGPGFNTALSYTVGSLSANTSHIGSAQGYAALHQWSGASDYDQPGGNSQPPGVYVSEGSVEEGDWIVTQGTPATHFSSGSSYGPISAPNGGTIVALNNAGLPETIMVKEFTMGINQHYLTLSGLANFVTTEFPNYVGSQYNDQIAIIVTTPGGQSQTITLAQLFGASVNASTFTAVTGLPPPMVGPGNSPPDSGGQTGFESFGQRLAVAPGGTVRIEVHVINAIDTQYPSAGLVTGLTASGGH